MTNQEIETKYVWNGDIYGSLMNGNIAINSRLEENRENATLQIQNLIKIASDELINQFLEIENWRSATIAGCLIGFKNRQKYIPQIGQRLVNQCGGVTGYCYALAKFSNEDSSKYLIQYLDKHLTYDKYPEEKFQDWAFSALRWIDKLNNSNLSNKYTNPDGLWNRFVNFEFKTKRVWKLSDSVRWGDLESADQRFEKMMNYYNNNFETN